MDTNKTTPKFKVSVGIPAYNEAANIRRLLDALSQQRRENFELIETIVVSDGSSDDTVAEARASVLNNVEIVAHTDRQGQAARQNEILDRYKGDLLVLLNADILPGSESMLDQAVSAFHKDPKIALVGIRHVPMPANTFIEKVINYSVALKADMFMELNGRHNMYNCRGGARVFSRKFTEAFRWDIHVAEDAYSYLRCKELGFKFYYADDIFVLYRSPSTLTDHLKQSVRFAKSQNVLNKLVDVKKIDPYHSTQKMKILMVLLAYLFRNPILFISYTTLLTVSKFSYWFMKSDPVKYDTSKSSKRIAT